MLMPDQSLAKQLFGLNLEGLFSCQSLLFGGLALYNWGTARTRQ